MHGQKNIKYLQSLYKVFLIWTHNMQKPAVRNSEVTCYKNNVV